MKSHQKTACYLLLIQMACAASFNAWSQQSPMALVPQTAPPDPESFSGLQIPEIGRPDRPVFGYYPGSPMALGKGLDIADPMANRADCGRFRRSTPDGATAIFATAGAVLVQNQRHLQQIFGIDANMTARYAIFQSSSSIISNNNVTEDANSITAAIVAREETGRIMTTEFQLREEYRTMLQQPGGARRFRELCGTHYISIEHRHQLAVALITLNNVTAEERRELTTEIRASAGLQNRRAMGVRARAKFHELWNRRSSSSEYNLQFLSVGGTGIQSYDHALGSVFNHNIDQVLSALHTGIQRFIHGFTPNNAAPWYYVATPYPGLPPEIQTEMNPQTQRTIQEITRRYFVLNRSIERVLDYGQHPMSDFNRDLARIVPPEWLAEAQTQIPATQVMLRRLREAHQNCFSILNTSTSASRCEVPPPTQEIRAMVFIDTLLNGLRP